MSLIKAEPGDIVSFTYTATDRATSLYPRAYVYDVAGNEVTTANLSHIANGFYSGQYTATGAYKFLTIHIIPYSDAARTVEADYASAESKLYVNYDSRPGISVVGGKGQALSEDDKEGIAKKVIEKIDLSEILDEIKKKSEFDPTKDVVKTDVKIPSVREIKDAISEIKDLVKKEKKTTIQQVDLSKIERLIKAIKIPDVGRVSSDIQGLNRAVSNIRPLMSPEMLEKLDSLEKMLEALNKEEFKRNLQLAKKFEELRSSIIPLIMRTSREPIDIESRFDEFAELLGKK